jgi:hypothetical protein
VLEPEEGQHGDQACEDCSNPPPDAHDWLAFGFDLLERAEETRLQKPFAQREEEQEHPDQRDQRPPLLPLPDLVGRRNRLSAGQCRLEPVNGHPDSGRLEMIAGVNVVRHK